ncbi:heme-binding protein [Burkholderiaceae bacterium DAT-1]|nr:heme-binding protein [Burkholderiaceae bacterium DAT-1]
MQDDLLTNRIAEIADAIQSYLNLRPGAADTLEGIHQWWIDWGRHEASPALTQLALERLLARGVMERWQLGGRVLWRRSRPKD